MNDPNGTSSRGYQLINLLVVLGIIVLLIGLMVPVLRRAQLIGAEARCQNNLRQLGLAVRNYAATCENQLPPLSGVPIAKDFAQPQTILFTLLPYIKEDVPYNLGTLYNKQLIYARGMEEPAGQTWNGLLPGSSGPLFSAGFVKTFVCPADSSNSTTEPLACGWVGSSYAANAQVFSQRARVVVDPRSGATWNELRSVYNIGNIPDGTSNTIFFAERFAVAGTGGTAVPNAWANPPANDAVCGGNPLCGPVFAYTVPYGNPMLDPLGQTGIGQPLPFAGGFGTINWVYPSPEIGRDPQLGTPGSAQSQHIAVVQVGMGDGSARRVISTIDLRTWLKAIQPNDGPEIPGWGW